MSLSDFRRFVPAPGTSRIAGKTAREHTKARLSGARPQELFGGWAKLFAAPFRGITTDGAALPGLFSLAPNGAPTESVANAAGRLLALLSPAQKAASVFPVESEQWRNWQNTELFVETHGLRLDEVTQQVRDAAMDVVRASLSAQGYEMSRNVMKLNRFLGDLVGGPGVLGEWSYTFVLFGAPSTDAPWGWQLFGHHLCLNCFLIGGQMVLTPAFMGAEPAHADEGPFKGIRLFEDEEREGLALMRSFSAAQRERAIVAHSMVGGDLPEGRRHFADNLHLGGAYQDNRIVPYEGLPAANLSRTQRRDLLDLVEAYLVTLPDGPRAARIDEVERHLNDTHFCWIGGTEEESAFYYRIQSPVVFIEFDHHGGVFLTNEMPAKFHVHTIVRTPNGNDYGIDLLRQHYENAAHHRHDRGEGHEDGHGHKHGHDRGE
jgi:hypothetical protein